MAIRINPKNRFLTNGVVIATALLLEPAHWLASNSSVESPARLAAVANAGTDAPDHPQSRGSNLAGKAANHYERGRLLIADQQWARAVDALNQAITLDSGARYLDEALYYLAFAQKKLNLLAEADQTLERLIAKYPRSPWADDARAMRLEIAPELGRVDDLARESRSQQNEEVRLAALQSLFVTAPAQARAVALEILDPSATSNSKLKLGVLTILRQVEDEDDRITSRLVNIATNDSDVAMRKGAINALWRNHEEQVLTLLRGVAVRSDNPELSEAALAVLGRRVSDRTGELLAEIAVSAATPEARKSALSKLSIRGGDDVIDQLISIVEGTGDLETKRFALSLAGRTISPHARAALLKVARGNGEEELRKTAVKLVGLVNDAETVELLSSLYDSESSVQVKRASLAALAKLDRGEAREKLMEVAERDASIELKREARSLLESSRDPAVRSFLQRLPRQN
jgi:tetratricopeptide (TPR) repeat protein